MTPAPFLLKAGRDVLTPDNSVMVIVSVKENRVVCKRRGLYAAEYWFSPSSLRPVPEGYDDAFTEVVDDPNDVCTDCGAPGPHQCLAAEPEEE